MKRKSAAEVLREVSPGLTVIEARAYPHRRGKKAIKLGEQPRPEVPRYKPHKVTGEEWEEAGGVICPICRKPTVRLLPYGFLAKRKACPDCIERRARLLEYKARIFRAKTAQRNLKGVSYG